MASDQSANLALPYLAAAQAQKHVTHNEALRRLDAYVQLALESVSEPEPPASPAEGARWFVPDGATGAFAGHAGTIAAYEAGAFDFLPVPADCLAFIRDQDRLARHDGAGWISPLAEALRDLSARSQLVLESVTATAPPATPAEGARWHVPAGATGAFAGHAGALASFEDGGFVFRPMPAGALAFIRDQWRLALHDGGAFVSPLAARPTRAAIEAEVLEEDVILFGATTDTTLAIPARAIVLGVSTRTLSGVSGAASYDCGIAGELSKFGGALGIALGASNSGVVGPTAFYTATPVRLTANGGTFTGGRVRVSIHILRCPAAVFPDLEAPWWTDASHLLDGVAPRVAADFPRERYAVAGAHDSSASIVSRTGAAKTVASAAGEVVQVPSNALAFDYSSGRRRLVMEGSATNLFVGSAAPAAAQNVTVTAQVYTLSFWGAGSIALSGAHAHGAAGTGAASRTVYTFTPSAGTLTLTPSGAVARVQLEVGGIATSHIETTVAAATRVTDVGSWGAAAVAEVNVAGCTIAYRGSVLSLSASQPIIGMNSVELARAPGSGDLSIVNLRIPGTSTYINSAAGLLPGDMGWCGAWNAGGALLAVNGAAPGTSPAAATGAVTSMWLGRASGLNAGTRHEIDALLVWPVRGTAGAVQAQARGWA